VGHKSDPGLILPLLFYITFGFLDVDASVMSMYNVNASCCNRSYNVPESGKGTWATPHRANTQRTWDKRDKCGQQRKLKSLQER